MGAMTGRAAGYCAGYSVPGFANQVPGRGFGFGRGRGFGRGMGFRGGRRWGGWGAPYAEPVPQYGYGPAPEQELDVLKEQAGYFKDTLDGIEKRIAELESGKEKKK